MSTFYILSHLQVLVNNFFQKFLLIEVQRRRWDLNPRIAINDLLPFQGSPFNHLGTSPNAWTFIHAISVILLLRNGEGGIRTHGPLLTTYPLSRRTPSTTWVLLHKAESMAERVGFEPTAPFGVTGFQDRLLKPLGHLSKQCFLSISNSKMFVNTFFY